MGRKDDPDLAPDAALAVEDTAERRAEQLAHLGGETDDIDDFDPAGLDDGSDLNFVPEDKDEDEDADKGSDTEGDEAEADKADDADEDEDDASEADDTESGDDEDDTEDDTEDEEVADEADSDDTGEDEGEADPKPAPKGIPKHRFDEVNERRKAAEQELADLKAEQKAAAEGEEETYDFDVAEKEYIELTLDGDTEGALAKRREIRAAEHAEWKAETKAETRTELDSDAETSELVALSKEAESMFDVFNPDHEDYNQPMLDKVLVYMRGYEQSSDMSRGDCFVAALADVVEQYDLMPPEEGDAGDDPKPKPKPTGKKKVDKKKSKVKEQAHQPVGDSGSSSADSGAAVPNIEEMTDEEFDALPAKTQARLRGDIL